MKIFVTGVAGQLGYDIVNEALKRGYTVVGSDLSPEIPDRLKNLDDSRFTYIPLDITDREKVLDTAASVRPDAIAHCAAWTAVDAAEDEDKADLVYKINVDGTRNMADAAAENGAKIVYLSTDYVFNGQGDEPWNEYSEEYEPLNHYGVTKLAGEKAVKAATDQYFIVRIAWVFGLNGNNFVKTMLKLADKYPALRVVNDQVGTPTYTFDLARLLVDMLETDQYGMYHATNSGDYISWYDFACEIFRQAGKNIEVIPVTTQEYGLSKASRPYNSRLNQTELVSRGFEPLPHWKDALARYLENVKIEEL